MDIPVTIAAGTAFDADYGESAILTVSFTTESQIVYKEDTTLYFYAVITEDLVSQTVCFEVSGGANPLPVGTTSYTIPNTSDFTDAAIASGKVYYSAA